MRQHMPLEIITLRKLGGTHAAFVVMLTGMSQHMCFEMAALVEGGRA